MFTEALGWSERLGRNARLTARTLVRKLTRKKYRDAYDYVSQAVKIYGKLALRREMDSKQVNAVLESIIDRENAVCWGVGCTHVARYMDKFYEQYVNESSESLKLLREVLAAHEAVQNAKRDSTPYTDFLRVMYRVKGMIDAYDAYYADSKAIAEQITRPGDGARIPAPDGDSEDTLP